MSGINLNTAAPSAAPELTRQIKQLHKESAKIPRNTYRGEHDREYRRIAQEHLALGNAEGALSTAAKIDKETMREGFLFQIMHQSSDPKILEAVASKMSSDDSKYKAYHSLFTSKILSKDIKGAIESAAKIPYYSARDKALMSVVVQSKDVKEMESATSKMGNRTNQNTAYEKIIDLLLAEKDPRSAIGIALKMNGSMNSDLALSRIIRGTEVTEFMDAAAIKIQNQEILDDEYKYIVGKKLAENTPESALKTALKISNSYLRDTTLIEIIQSLNEQDRIQSLIDKIDHPHRKKKAYKVAIERELFLGNQQAEEFFKEKLRVLKEYLAVSSQAEKMVGNNAYTIRWSFII